MAVLPGVLIYAVSVQFVTKSIDTWFDVRVEKALESGLDLGRGALDSLLSGLAEKGRLVALELSALSESQRRLSLGRLREQSGAQFADAGLAETKVAPAGTVTTTTTLVASCASLLSMRSA